MAKRTSAPRFKFGNLIGSGGFGDVFEAARLDEHGNIVDTNLAVKKLRPEWTADEKALNRFRREVRYLQALDHRNILPIVGRNLSVDPPFFVMPRASDSLHDRLRGRGTLESPWIVTTYRQILEGVAHAHSRGVIHRDIKPQNVLFVDGVPKVADLGLGKRFDSSTTDLTSQHVAMGTLPYMAPEQFDDAAHVGPQPMYSRLESSWARW